MDRHPTAGADAPAVSDPADTYTTRAHDLLGLINRVWHAVPKDESRPVLSSVLWEGDEQGLRLVAADNYRIAFQRLTTDPHPDWGRLVVARAHMTVLRAALKVLWPTAEVTVTRHADALHVATQGRTAMTLVLPRYPHAEWPNYIDARDRAPTAESVAVRADFLGDTGRALPKGAILRLAVGGPMDPVRASWTDDEGYTEIVMPVRMAHAT